MNKSIEQVIEDAKRTAAQIIGETEAIRELASKVQPSASCESTVEGTLKAMKCIVDNHTPHGYTRSYNVPPRLIKLPGEHLMDFCAELTRARELFLTECRSDFPAGYDVEGQTAAAMLAMKQLIVGLGLHCEEGVSLPDDPGFDTYGDASVEWFSTRADRSHAIIWLTVDHAGVVICAWILHADSQSKVWDWNDRSRITLREIKAHLFPLLKQLTSMNTAGNSLLSDS